MFNRLLSEIESFRTEYYNNYPLRNRELQEITNYKFVDLLHLLKNELYSKETFKPDQKIINKAEHISKNPIFVCGPMRSGTTLTIQLLDGHSNLLVMPGDSSFLKYVNSGERLSSDEIAYRSLYKFTFRLSGNWFFRKDKNTYIDFLGYLDFYLNNSDQDAVVCVMMAIYSVFSDIFRETCFWVAKYPNIEFQAVSLMKKFPNARFINVLRDPLTNLNSLKKNYHIRGKRF